MTNLMRKMKRKAMMMRWWSSKSKPRRGQPLLLSGQVLLLPGVGLLLPEVEPVGVLLQVLVGA